MLGQPQRTFRGSDFLQDREPREICRGCRAIVTNECRRRDRKAPCLNQQLRVQTIPLPLPKPDRKVHASRSQRAHVRVRINHHIHLGMFHAKLRKSWHQSVRRETRCRGNDQRVVCVFRRHLRHLCADRFEAAAYHFGKHEAFIRQLRLPRGAIQKGHVEKAFKVSDLLANRRMRHAEGSARARHRPAFRIGMKRAQRR